MLHTLCCTLHSTHYTLHADKYDLNFSELSRTRPDLPTNYTLPPQDSTLSQCIYYPNRYTKLENQAFVCLFVYTCLFVCLCIPRLLDRVIPPCFKLNSPTLCRFTLPNTSMITIYCTLYAAHYTLQIIHCTLYTAKYTLHTHDRIPHTALGGPLHQLDGSSSNRYEWRGRSRGELGKALGTLAYDRAARRLEMAKHILVSPS